MSDKHVLFWIGNSCYAWAGPLLINSDNAIFSWWDPGKELPPVRPVSAKFLIPDGHVAVVASSCTTSKGVVWEIKSNAEGSRSLERILYTAELPDFLPFHWTSRSAALNAGNIYYLTPENRQKHILLNSWIALCPLSTALLSQFPPCVFGVHCGKKS